MLLRKLKLKTLETPCTLVGPTPSQLKPITFNVAGTTVSIALPKHKTHLSAEQLKAKPNYTLERHHFNNLVTSKDEWLFLPIVLRHCDFYGPVFTGPQGTLTISIGVARKQQIDDTNYFLSQGFEGAVSDYLSFMYSDIKLRGEQSWLAPYNWKPLPKLGARYDIKPNSMLHKKCEYEKNALIPLSSSHMLACVCDISWSTDLRENKEPDAEWINPSEMLKLADAIIDSIDVKLSDEAEKERKAAMQASGNQQLTTHFPPLKWS